MKQLKTRLLQANCLWDHIWTLKDFPLIILGSVRLLNTGIPLSRVSIYRSSYSEEAGSLLRLTFVEFFSSLSLPHVWLLKSIYGFHKFCCCLFSKWKWTSKKVHIFYVCVFMHVEMCMCAPICIYMWSSEDNLRLCSQEQHLPPLRLGLSLFWKSSSMADVLASVLQGFLFLGLPCIRIPSVHCHAWHVCMGFCWSTHVPMPVWQTLAKTSHPIRRIILIRFEKTTLIQLFVWM